MFNIPIKTGQRIVKVAFWLGAVAAMIHTMRGDYYAFGLLYPFIWGGISAFCVAGVLALLKRY